MSLYVWCTCYNKAANQYERDLFHRNSGVRKYETSIDLVNEIPIDSILFMLWLMKMDVLPLPNDNNEGKTRGF